MKKVLAVLLCSSFAATVSAQSSDLSNLKILPSGWSFAGGSYDFIRLPNGDKALGAVQRCGGNSVLIVATEGRNSFSEWMRFKLASVQNGQINTQSDTLATYQQDGGSVAMKPELRISGSGNLTVEGTTVYANGNRVAARKTVSNCNIM